MTDSLREIIESYDDRASLARAETIPASWYTDSRIAGLEKRSVFAGSWQVVGRVKQVLEPGQFLIADVAGEPILVSRGADAVLRAFYNVCRHHAAAVETRAEGVAPYFRCPYHGWTYGIDGALKGVPEFEGVENFDRGANGLVPTRVAPWENLVFVNLDQRAVALEKFIGTLAARVTPLCFDQLHFFERRSYELACNWKVYVDNYLDGGYHVPHLHKGLDSVLEYVDYTIENGERFSVQSSPMKSIGADAEVAASRRGDRAYYFWLYPNVMLNWYEGYLDTNLVIPLSTNRCAVIFDFYFADVSEPARARNLESMSVSDRVQNEDVAICEAVQRGLHSKAYRAGRLSVRREAGEHLFHRLLAADLKKGLADGSPVR